MSLTLRPRAKSDLISIAKHIADQNPAAALNWYDEVMAVCRMLGDVPLVGQAREDIREGLRTFPKGNYIIVFRSTGKGVIIERVIHSARDWPKLVR